MGPTTHNLARGFGATLVLTAGAFAAKIPSTQPPADAQAEELERRFRDDVRPLLAAHCFSCHAGEEAKGDIDLERLSDLRAALALGGDLALLKEMVATGEMPPAKSPQPSDLERLILTQWFESASAYVPPDATIDPGWFTIHRLNRTEYRNALRDLLGIDPAATDVAARLPADDTGYGFDNIADVLSVSPLAVEAYLDAAEKAVALALGPAVQISAAPKPLRLTGGANGHGLPGGGHYLYSNGAVSATIDAPATGEYLVRIEAWETRAGDEHARISLRIDGKEHKAFFISGTRDEPQTVDTRIRLNGGRHGLAAHFTNDYWRPNVADRNLGIEAITLAGPLNEETTQRPAAWNRLFGFARTIEHDEARALAVLSRFAEHAYRRPLREGEPERLMTVYRAGIAAGAPFEEAVRNGLTAVLVSPNFLYRTLDNPHPDDPSAVYRLNGYELASRLSFFLWSSGPDDTLLATAADRSLLTDEVLTAQTRRMLADTRADAFITNFTGQWLQLRTLNDLAIDTALFPDYSPALREAMETEARLFVGAVVRGEGTLLDLLDARYAMLNEPLARLYGVPGVRGTQFRRVNLPDTSPRGGVLTMGAVLTVTSNPTRTSPVKRGLFVLEEFLGTPPPPPPADIPRLEQAQAVGPDATLREALAAHVANPNCAVCHNRLDPIGLAFEHFDAVGLWRDRENGRPIDSSGVLPGGIPISGSGDLKRLLVNRADQFIETLAAKVLTYAVGRGPEPFDRPAVRRIAARTREGGDRFPALIEAVVLSDTFRSCRGRGVRHE